MNEILLTVEQLEIMRQDVIRRQPNEACGLAAGRANRVEVIFPVANDLASPVRYRMNPAQQIKIFFEIEQLGQELVAIYHSHPHGPAVPSETDIGESAYPEAVYLIWSPAEAGWQCRGFNILADKISEVEIAISE